MTENHIQSVFQICSYLLSYPDEDFPSSLEEVEAQLNTLNMPLLTEELYHFCKKAKNQSANELISTYIDTFDFGKKTNLYVSYMANGEQRERGMDLLFLKNYYKMHGFHITDKELPDYLPVLLEFAGLVDAEKTQPVFARYMKSIKEIASHLNPEENVYGHIFQTILSALEMMGINEMNSEVKEYA